MPYKLNVFHLKGSDKPNPPAETNHQSQQRSEVPAVGEPRAFQEYREEEVNKAVEWFTTYLNTQRDEYYPGAQPLSDEHRKVMGKYFEGQLLDRVRVLELVDHRVANPWFYPQAVESGLRHLPDIPHKAAVTFLDVVVFNEKMASRDLFHGLVHAAQVRVLGRSQFAEFFVRGFLQARSYFLVPLKAQAFALDARFASNPDAPFSVEEQIREWRRQGRY
ncbi:MAG TPA: hypothetical protein VIW23_14595 [Candidatus Acidoferrum sp.]